MLSYRHSFHAGNFADVIKHIVLVEILEHLIQKESPFEYIDTHAGAGLFSLESSHAQKLQEYRNGIGKLDFAAFPELSRYFAAIDSCNKSKDIRFYPGSPLIARTFLRSQDRAWLYELHPQDYQSLGETIYETIGNNKKIRIFCEDGLKGLEALLPPTSRRGLVLIDPSYEIKSDYDQVFNTLVKAHKKFATGIYALWYPVVDRHRIIRLEKRFILSGIRNIQRFELGISADSEASGMTAAGMIVINPPWKLFAKMSNVLPKLTQVLGEQNESFFKCDILVNE